MGDGEGGRNMKHFEILVYEDVDQAKLLLRVIDWSKRPKVAYWWDDNRMNQNEVAEGMAIPTTLLEASETGGVDLTKYWFDLMEAGDNSPFHYQCDVLILLHNNWDLMVAHPPCTHLAVSGARYFAQKVKEQSDALDFVRVLLDAPIPKIALENPISIISTRIRKPDQIIQLWMFGHGETKATCLWLKNPPLLTPTHIVEGREARCHKMPPGQDRWKNRSRTYKGIAKAMADQWGGDNK